MPIEPERRARSADLAGSAFGVVLVLFLACFLAEDLLYETTPAVRYLKYLLPVIAFGITVPLVPQVTATPFARRDLPDFLVVAAVVIVVSIAVLMVGQAPHGRALQEAYFVMAPLITAYIIFPTLRPERIARYADWLFVGSAASYFVERGGAIADALSQPGGLWVQLVTSSSAAESGASFVFGMLALYYLCSRRRSRALWALALMLLSFKRIAMFGTLTCLLLWGLLQLTRVDLRRHWRLVAVLAVLGNGLALLVAYWLSAGDLSELITRHTGLSSNWATMGRESLYAAIFSRFELEAAGNGLGAVTAYLEAEQFATTNAHSDVVKYVVEVGPMLAAAWLWALFRLARGSSAALLLVVYANILFISDNVSIYFGFMFMLYVLIGFASIEDARRAQSRPSPTS